MRPIPRACVLAFAVLALPAAAAAQKQIDARVPVSPSRNEARAWYAELQDVAQRLQQVHRRALEDPALREAHRAVGAALQQAVHRIDPGLERLTSRYEALQAEMQRAQQTGDAARASAVWREMEPLAARFQAAHERAVREPAMAARIRAYEAQLRREMLRVEPATEQLVERGQELKDRIDAVLRSRAPAASPRQQP